MAEASLDEVVHTRLIVDGEHHMTQLSAAYLQFVKAVSADGASAADAEARYQDVMRLVSMLELHVSSSDHLRVRCEREVAHYTKTRDRIAERIALTRREIDGLSTKLAEERTIKQNKEQYEVLAKQINQLPARDVQAERRKELEQELEQLSRQRAAVDTTLSRRRHDFQLLMHCIVDLQRSLGEEPTVDAVEDDRPDAAAAGGGSGAAADDDDDDDDDDGDGEDSRTRRGGSPGGLNGADGGVDGDGDVTIA